MFLSLYSCLRKIAPLWSCAILLTFAASVHADPKPLSKAEQAKVDKAVDKAVAFVKKSQKETGEFDADPIAVSLPGLYANHGFHIFPGLALLESGVPANDPVIQKTARLVRDLEPQMDRTYEVAVALLFLDRLGDPKDKERIRSLALRLIVAQTYTGGWGYYCPLLSEQNQRDLWNTLCVLQAKGHRESSRRDEKASTYRRLANSKPVIPPRLRVLAIFQDPKYLFPRRELGIHEPAPQPDLNRRFIIGTTENCCTQLAILALWAASRHDIPTDRTFALVVKRFVKTQNKDGTWDYRYAVGRASRDGSMSTTATGLLGLAMAYELSKSAPENVELDIRERIIKGLLVLSKEIGTPTGQMHRPTDVKDVFFLWSVGLVAKLYNLPQIGEKDWYRWGAEIFVTNQSESGAWDFPKLAYGSILVRTSFGLLFLKRANPSRELSAKIALMDRQLNKSLITRLRSLEDSTSQSTKSLSTTFESKKDP